MGWFARKLEERRQAKAARRADRESLGAAFVRFVADSEEFAPVAPKHPVATLYRHVWKRAVALEDLSTMLGSAENAQIFRAFQSAASNKYSPVAPTGAYGPIHLKISGEARRRLQLKELERLLAPLVEAAQPRRDLACIYVGFATDHAPYVGQTIDEPERRWRQHRREGTGPFRKGSDYARWEVLEGNVPLNKLDEIESYYIGYYNAFEAGLNENRGNNLRAYQRGLDEGRARPK